MDVLRLSEDHHQWLRTLDHRSLQFTDEQLVQFLQDVISALLSPKHPIRYLEQTLSPENSVLAKQSVAGLASLLVEASKGTLPVMQLYLQAIDLSEKKCNIIVETYNSRKTDIRRAISTVGFSLPHIVDVDWRLDYCVASKDFAHAAQPRYQISLHTVSGINGDDCISFSTSVEELQAMVWKLKEAVKSVEKHASH